MRAPHAVASLCLFLAAAVFAQTLPAASTLLPIPDPTAQTKSRDLVHSLFKDDYARKSPADQIALAKRLLNEALATKDDVTARYVLLTEAANLAAAGADVTTAMSAATELARVYAINGTDLQSQILFRASSAAPTPENCEPLARCALDVADQAAISDDFELVRRLADLADSAAQRTRKFALVAALQPRIAALRALIVEFAEAHAAADKLQSNPNDTDAHLTLGRFYALHKGDFSIGLTHLAIGSDAPLRALADADLANPTDPLKQVELGDAWWDLAEKSPPPTRSHATARARHWYALAKETLTGFTLTRIQSRLQSEVAQPTTSPSAAPATALTAPTNGIHLLGLIDPAQDAAEGKWSFAANELTCNSTKYATLELPYNPPEEFDLRIAFTRTDGQGPITILLASHNKSFGFALDVKGEARFERVANKIAKDNPTSVPVSISNNHRYSLTLQLRKDSIRALLDDKPLTQWKTDYKDLARYALWKLPDDKLCGLGANNAQVTFHAVDLIEVTGTGKPTRGK